MQWDNSSNRGVCSGDAQLWMSMSSSSAEINVDGQVGREDNVLEMAKGI